MGLRGICIYCGEEIELPKGSHIPYWSYCEKCKKFMITEFKEETNETIHQRKNERITREQSET